MAYSGLGAGTLLDPYQITTVSQYKEQFQQLNAVVKYFKLMNDLDWKNENFFGVESVNNTSNQLYFMSKLNGNGKKLLNIPSRGYGFNFYSDTDVSILNIALNYKSVVSGSACLFYSEAGTSPVNATIDNLKVIVHPGNSPVWSQAKFSATSSITNTHFEGQFSSSVFGRTNGFISNLVVNNVYSGACRIVDLYAGSTLEKFRVYKPYTKITSFPLSNHFAPFCSITYGACTIRQGFLNLGNIEVSPVSIYSKGDLLYTNNSGGLVTTIQDCYVYANEVYDSVVSFADNLAQSSSNDVWDRVHFYGWLHDGNNEARNTFFGYGQFDNCYYNKDLRGTYDLPGQTGLTTAEFLEAANFSGWDFTNVWQIGSKYPLLRNALEDSNLDYAPQNIDVSITDTSITLTPHFNNYFGYYGFEVVRLSDGVVLLDVPHYINPVLFDPSGNGGIQARAYIYNGENRWYCGGAFFSDYEPAASPGLAGSSPAVALLQLTIPEDLGGGTFAGFHVEKKTDSSDWEVIEPGYQGTILYQEISRKTYFRVAAITEEYGVGALCAPVTVTPVGSVGGGITGLAHKVFLGGTLISIR